MSKIKKKIEGAILDRVRKSLDEKIWDLSHEPPILRNEFKDEILTVLFTVLRNYNLKHFEKWVDSVLLVGSLTTLQYTETSDIDITVIINLNLFKENNSHIEQPEEFLKKIMHEISGKLYDKTLHRINFYVRFGKMLLEQADGIYEIISDNWIKRYPFLDESFDPEEVFSEFKKQSEEIMRWIEMKMLDIRNTVTDIQLWQDILSEVEPSVQKDLINRIRNKIVFIENEIMELSEIYDELKEARDRAFILDKYDKTGFLAYKFSANWMPANIVYKFLERYNYINLLHAIKKLSKEPILDINKVREVYKSK